MKKSISLLIAFVLCLTMVLPFAAMALTANATLSGPGTVRAGDTITLTFNLSGSGLYGATGTLSYNSSQLTLTGTSQKIASPWIVEFNGNNFVAYDNNLASPITGSKALFTATFKVSGSLAAGTPIQVSYTNVIASDGSQDVTVGTVGYSVSIAAPLSTDNTLKSMTVSNAAISPAFNSATTFYTASVPFEVSKLELQAQANHPNASVKVSSPTLTANSTTQVTVTVTAENGASKTYTIQVTRAQDPNYVPSGENSLSGITVDGFLLSPGFTQDRTAYIIWLPYETEKVSVSGVAADSKANVRVVGGENLVPGADNEIQVICTAEDGTEKVYTVIAKRAAAHGSAPEGTTPPETTQPTQPTDPAPTQPTDPKPTQPEATQPEETKPEQTQPQQTLPAPTEPQPGQTPSEDPAGGVAVWVPIVAGVLSAMAGLGAGFVIGSKKK